MTYSYGSVCTGYEGIGLGLSLVEDIDIRWQAELDPHASKILATRFPNVPNLGDIKTVDWTQVEPVDIFSAGYPCQPFSHAGKRKGTDDERHIWPYIADAISVLRPRRLLLENVAGHLSLGFDRVAADLASLRYDTQWIIVRASDAGACHGRKRLFVSATDASGERHGRRQDGDGVDGVDGDHAGEARERQRSRQVAGDRDTEVSRYAAGSRRDARAATSRSDESTRPARGSGLAPTYPSCDGRDERRTEPAGLVGRPDAAERSDVPADSDSLGLQGVRRLEPVQRDADRCGSQDIAWGDYEPAIRRWESVTGRPAPRPTEPGRSGERLAPAFVEWMMGLPAGWVTDIDISRNEKLKALGNGVVPQQCALAWRTLLSLETCGVAA